MPKGVRQTYGKKARLEGQGKEYISERNATGDCTVSASELGANSVLTRSTLLLVCANQGSSETKARPKEDQKELRRDIEESCVCTHAKAPARSGLSLALGLMVSILLMTICFHARAQQRNDVPEALGKGLSVSGKVISAVNGAIIQGATITNKRTGIHTVTDGLGEYRISAKPDDVLRYSYMGYISVEERIDGRERITVALDSAEHMLEEVEVVSTGYQTLPKERATGSFVFVDSALLNRAVSTDIISRLKGVVPSLMFDERAGGDPKLSIRGRSTIFANADPLIVVDNFPYEGDIRNINPNDVESVSILRDAAAASIWGVRAGNGVIVITTKKGKAGQPLQVSFNGNVTVGEKPDLWYEPRISSADLIAVEEFLYGKGYYNSALNNTRTYPVISPAVALLASGQLSDAEKQDQLDRFRRIDIRRDIHNYFYRREVNRQYALNIVGSTPQHRYSLSGGFDNNDRSAVGNTFRRTNLSARNAFSLARNVQLTADLWFTQANLTANEVLRTLHDAFPYQRLAGDQGEALPIVRDFNAAFATSAAENGRLDWQYYPLDELRNSGNTISQQNYRINTDLSYVPLPGLRAAISYQYERQNGVNNNLMGMQTYEVRDWINRFTVIDHQRTVYNFPFGALLDRQTSQTLAHNGRAQLNYDKSWAAHQINAISGMEIREVTGSAHASRYYGYDPHTGTSLRANTDSLYLQYPQGNRVRISNNTAIGGSLERFRSWFANGSYQLHSRYTLSLSGRIDQTNLFGVKANQRTVPLWSAGLKWQVDRERFYQIGWLPELSLRATHGYNGNFDRNTTAYITAMYLTAAATGQREANLGGLPNPQLKGERNAVTNVGIDFGIAGGRVNGRVDYYARRGRDLVGNGPIDATTGRTVFRGNLADMKGTGWDVELNTRNAVGKLSWDSYLMVSHTRNEVTRYGVEPTNLDAYFFDASFGYGNITPIPGKPLFAVYSYPWAGLDDASGDPRGRYRGEVLGYTEIPYNSIGIDDLILHGSAIPTSFGAIRNTFGYRNFSLSVNITYKLGYYFRRPSVNYGALFGANGLGHQDYADRWQQPGDETRTDVPSMVYPNSAMRDNFYLRSEVLVERGDHVRVQDVQFDYRFPEHVCSRMGIAQLRTYVYAANPGILWRANRHGIDPDFQFNPNTNIPVLPKPFSMALGISTTF
ncbi:SusC/RagA family TonB-linked outer membrane protein [Parapedobacter deserti]|uniref:SusC/RagA family TonB-linked outer membrane protein n=1 Tax=Parapedobacter deserti TaxID=1912957 RepID=A0ABV7JNF1_9SPHI